MAMREATKVSPDVMSNFYIMPNLTEYELDIYEFRLYAHIRFRAGNSNEFWESVETTATYCNMGVHKVREARQSLVDKGYITLEKRDGETFLIKPVNIWERNREQAQKPPSLPQIYEAQTGKNYSEWQQSKKDLSDKRKGKKKEGTPSESVTPYQSVKGTPYGSVTPTPYGSVRETIFREQNAVEQKPSPPTTPTAAEKKNKKATEEISEDLKKTLQLMADILGINLETYAGRSKTIGYLKRWLAGGLKVEQIMTAAAAWNDSYLVKQKRQRGEQVNPPTFSQLQELATKKPSAPQSSNTSGDESKTCPKCNNSGFIFKGYATDGTTLGTMCNCPHGKAKQSTS